MAIITNKHNVTHYTWGNNCDGWPLAETPGLSVKQENMPAGTREQLHYHKTAQQYFYILKGTATFYCENDEFIVSAQTGILINAGTQHYVANQSNTTLEFLVISQPSTQNDRMNV
jgi:mannose-6-phosphate isomerase-like protein (cupin superfamily)